MSVNDNEFAKALMIERVYDVGKYGFLRFVARMHAKRQLSLTRILRTHANGRHHHDVQSVLVKQALGGINGDVVRQDAVR